MDKDRFSAHGEVHAHYQPTQKILHIDLVGPFNLEFMQKYERVVGAQRKTIDSPCWGSLAVVLHEAEGVEMQKKFWSRVYESSTLAFEYFDDTTLATQWLSERVLASVQARSVDQLNSAKR